MPPRVDALSEPEIRRITMLLSQTDMSISEIAERMQCSRSTVASVNRRFQIRDYAGLRSKWTVKVSMEQVR